jgi:hypothetical protein
MPRPELHVSLDSPLPRELRVGRGTALFLAGTCYCPTAALTGVRLRAGGAVGPAIAFGMPRLDFFAELHPGLDPFATDGIERDYRSGFWGVLAIPADPGVELRIAVQATLADGREVETELPAIRVVGPIAHPLSVEPAQGGGL